MGQKICEKCGQSVSAQNYSRHIKRCDGTGFRVYVPVPPIPDDQLFCRFCNRRLKNANALRQHECRCPRNPNRKAWDHLLDKNHQSLRKGHTAADDPVVAKQRETMLKKYKNGYISPNLGVHRPRNYIFKEHNDREIKKWLDFISSKQIVLDKDAKQGTSIIEGYYTVKGKSDSGESLFKTYTFFHNYIANKLLDNQLTYSNTVHHINQNRADNSKDNLMVFVNSDHHKRFHNSNNAYLIYDDITHLFSCEFRDPSSLNGVG